MVQAIGSCCNCNKPIVYLKWREEKVVIVVWCKDCNNEIIFDLEKMYSALVGDDEDECTRILQNFVPKGKPS